MDSQLSYFDFELPESRIALAPAMPRDHAKLLHVPAGKALNHKHVFDLPDLLRSGDVLVLNNTKVIPARLYGRRGQAKVECLLHRDLGGGLWEAFARPAKRLKLGDNIVFGDGFCAEVAACAIDGVVKLRFAGAEFQSLLNRHGQVPLPPYIRREALPEDQKNYQTVYAEKDGSVAAPTAGLHFTPGLLETIRARGVQTATLTLHVGAGTFLPVKSENLDQHVMHAEQGEISVEAAERINAARARGGRIVAVGTTSCRLLEAAADEQGRLQAFNDEVRLFIRPGYRFKMVDALLTNFHLPRSTLFMLVCAFAGTERMKAAYAEAIAEGYRFYSYGDACFLERSD